MVRDVFFISLFHGALSRQPLWLGFYLPIVDCGFGIPGNRTVATDLGTSAAPAGA